MLEYNGDKQLRDAFDWFTRQISSFTVNFEKNKDLSKLISNIIFMFSLRVEIENNEKYSDDLKESVNNALNVVSSMAKNMNINALLNLMTENPKKKKKEENPNSVKLLTVHSSKGLESKICFLISCDNGKFPSNKNNDYLEEVRLFYVAITRAKERLYLSCTDESQFLNQYEERMIK